MNCGAGWRRRARALGVAVSLLVTEVGFGQTTASWVNAVSGTWTDPINWSTNPVFPNGSFNAVLNASGGAHTVSLAGSGVSLSVESLTLNSPDVVVHQSSGTLAVNGSLNIFAGQYLLNGGTLESATIAGINGGLLVGAGNFRNVAIESDVIHDQNTLTIHNGLALNSGRLVLNRGATRFEGSQVVSGTGELVAGVGVGSGSFEHFITATGTLTFDQGIAVRAAGANLTINNVLNGFVVNRGLMEVANAQTFNLSAPWTNEGTLRVNGAGTLVLGAASMSTGSMGTLENLGGTVRFNGTIDNTGTVLSLHSGGSWFLGTGGIRGRIIGGTIQSVGGATLDIQNGAFDNVTLDIDAAAATIEVNSTLTLMNRTLDVASRFDLNPEFMRSIQVTGSGTIRLASGVNVSSQLHNPTTFGSAGMTIIAPGNHTFARLALRGLIEHDGVGTLNIDTVKNLGLIRTLGGNIRFTSTPYADMGLLEMNGGRLYMTGTIENQGTNFQLNSMTGSGTFFHSGLGAALHGGTLSTIDGTTAYVNAFLLADVRVDTDLAVIGSVSVDPLTTILPGHTLALVNASLGMPNAPALAGSKVVMSGISRVQGSGSTFTGNTMTLGPGMDLRVTSGTTTITGGSQELPVFQTFNQGTIHAENPGTKIRIANNVSTGTFTNSGTIQLDPGTELFVELPWRNPGGTLLINNSTVHFNAIRTAELGFIQNNQGTVIVNGLISNTNSSLLLNSQTGTWYLRDSISNGTIVTQDGKSLVMLQGSKLFTAALAGHILSKSEQPSRIELFAPVMYNGSITIANEASSGSLEIYAPFGFRGNGTVSVEGTSSVTRIRGEQMLLEPGVTFRTVTQGATIGLNGTTDTFTNQGTLIHATAGKQLALGGTWTNQGLLKLSDGTLLLGGTFTLGGGTFERTGGVVVMSGQFNNTGTTNLDTTLGPMLLSGEPRIVGGTITSSQSDALTLIAGRGSFDSTTIAADIKLLGGTSLTLNSATLSGSGRALRLMGPGDSYVLVRGASDLGTLSEISLSGTGANSGILPADSGTFTLPSTLRIFNADGGGGTIGSTERATINNGTILAQSPGLPLYVTGATLVNNGLMRSENGGTLIIQRLRSNTGTIDVQNGSIEFRGTVGSVGTINASNTNVLINTTMSSTQIKSMNLTDSNITVGTMGVVNNTDDFFTLNQAVASWRMNGGTINNGSINSVGTASLLIGRTVVLNGVDLMAPVTTLNGATLDLRGNWSNSSTITVNDSRLFLRGNFTTQQMGTIVQTGTTSLVLSGTWDNSGATVDVGGDPNPWVLMNGAISGGTILSNNFPLVGQGSMIGVSLGAEWQNSGGTAAISEGLTFLGGAIRLGPNSTSTVSFSTNQTVDGSGTILFDSTSFNNRLRVASGTTTLGSGVVVRTGAGSGSIAAAAGARLINQGTISSQTSGRGIAIGGSFTNEGVVEVRNGGTSSLVASLLGNYSVGTLTGGRWAVYANSTMAMGSSTITTNNANVLLDGVNSTFAPINPLHTNLGTFAIDHGRNFVTGGSLNNLGLLGIGTSSTMYVSGSLDNTGSIDLRGTLIVNYSPGDSDSAIFETLVGQIGSTILSSNADPAQGVGSAENAVLGYTTFAGLPVDDTTVLLMLTYFGDANLDGVADLADFNLFLDGFAPADATPLWVSGDFDYSGVVNLMDFELYLHGYYALGGSQSAITNAVKNASLPQGTEDAMLNLVATVPEPSLIGVFGLLGSLGLRRRRD